MEAQAGHAAHHVEVHLARDVVANIGHTVEAHHMVLAVADYRKYHILLLRRQAAVETADLVLVLLQIWNHILGLSKIFASGGKILVGGKVEIAQHPVAYHRVVGQFVEERGIVLGAAHEHCPVAKPGVLPVAFDHIPHAYPEGGDHHEHRNEAQQIQPPHRHRKPPDEQHRSSHQHEPEHVAQHVDNYLRPAGLPDMEYDSPVGDAGEINRADDQLRLEGGRRADCPSETKGEKKYQVADHYVPYHDHELHP